MNKQTAALLAQHFDIAFSAPNGIKKLRELILTLAMQGKLVEQDPNDPPASQLLKEIEAEKKLLIKEGKTKDKSGSREGAKTRSEIKKEEAPYVLPQGWEWVRLQDFSEYNGRVKIDPTAIDQSSWILDLEDIEKVTSRLLYRAKYSERESKSTKSTFKVNDVLYGKLRPYLDKVIVADADGVCTTEIVPIVPSRAVSPQFLRWLLKRPSFLAHVNSLMYGVKMPRLGTEDAVNSNHPLPPIEEQNRIVAKIDQLMARCDALENLRNACEEKRLAVHAAALSQLLETSSNGSPDEAWAFITQHFGELYAVKENVVELRKAILQLAVMGKLVPQDPNDLPASQLLKEIEAEKKQLATEGKIRGTRSREDAKKIKSDDMPYVLPEGWEWVHFESIVDIGSGITKGRNLSGRKTVSIPYLRVANVQRGYLDLTEIKEIEIPDNEIEKLQLANGDLLITEGGDWDKVGRTSIWRSEILLCAHQNHIFKARKILETQNEIWLEKYLNSPTARTYFAGASKQTTNLASINKTQLRVCPIPIPPLSEQHRIVAKIDLLMESCDTLEQHIAASIGKQTELLNAVMAQV